MVVAATLLAACGGPAGASDESSLPARGASSGAAEVPAEPGDEHAAPIAPTRIAHLALELEDLMNVRDPGAEQTRVALVVTDETGSARRHVLGVFDGVCTEADVGVAEAGLARSALVGADCPHRARGSRIRVVRDGGEIVGMRAWVDESEDPDEFPSYDEIQRVELREGAELVTGEPPR